MNSRHLLALLLAAAVPAVVGCREEEGIHSYTIPKPHVIEKINPGKQAAKGESQDRMLAAIVPQGEQAWFFKLTGPADAVGEQAEKFGALVKSVRLSATGDPKWELPEGWQQQAGNSFRFATIKIADHDRLDLSVSRLPWDAQHEEQMVLENVNRWRGQLQLPPLVANQLSSETEQIEVDGAAVTMIDLKGRMGASGLMGRAPFAGGAGGAMPPASNAGDTTSKDTPSAPPLGFDAPEEWEPAETGGIRRAAFRVSEGEQKVEITVIPLPKAAGAVEPVVNLWRKQLGLEAIPAAELSEQVKKIPAGDVEASYVALESPADVKPQQMILGAIAEHDEQAWFVKLQGDAELAKREQQRFEDFVRSLKFHE